MMKKLRKFKCGHCQREYEQFAEDDVMSIDCKCKSKAARMLAAPRCFQNTTGKSPSC